MEIFWCILIAAVVVALGIAIILKLKKNRRLWIFLYVFLLILVARLILNFLDPALELNALEKIFNGIIRTFQSFTLDEDYTGAVITGEELLKDSAFAPAYGIVSSFLNVCAPILGGALLLDILTSIFPQLRLFFRMKSHKLVFSELNEAAVCLAEDVYSRMEEQKKEHKRGERKDKAPRVLLVFADVYKNEKSESYSELLARAEALNAVCIRTDPSALNLRYSKSVSYLLIDTDPIGNIDGLSLLLDPAEDQKRSWPAAKKSAVGEKKPEERKKPAGLTRRGFACPEIPEDQDPQDVQSGKDDTGIRTRIYVFVQTETESSIIQRIIRESGDAKDQVLVRSIRDYMNALVNLMYDVPLFLPLLMDREYEQGGTGSKAEMPWDRQEDLTVTILGGGWIAEEAFRAVFWCGQMYHVQLHMNVLSRHADKFRDRVREACPELLDTCRQDSEKLRVFPHREPDDWNPPYSTEPVFMETEDASLIFKYGELPVDILSETDYYIIALGSDELNLEVADSLRIVLERRALTGETPLNVIIAPAVFDSCLAEAAESVSPAGHSGIQLIPFASNRSRFSCRNVFMEDFVQASEGTSRRYTKINQNKIQEKREEYTYWANVARSVHAPYKLYCMGALKSGTDAASGRRYIVREGTKVPQEQTVRDRMAWMEHRRWNAFMRTQGFSCPAPEQYRAYYDPRDPGQHKSIQMKLHPCLVESEVTLREFPDVRELDRDKISYDFLDNVSFGDFRLEVKAGSDRKCGADRGRENTQAELVDLDYKTYDYPEYDEALTLLLKPPAKEK